MLRVSSGNRPGSSTNPLGDLNDLFRTFNCGIGMVLFVKAEYVSTVLGKVKNSIVIGNVVDRGDPGTEQVKIEGSPW